MRVVAMDHIVLNVADVERSLAFYSETLGLPAERVEQWRGGKVGFPSVRVNEHTIIDLVGHPPSGDNLAHFCLVADGDIEALRAEVEAKGVAIERGPASRSGHAAMGSASTSAIPTARRSRSAPTDRSAARRWRRAGPARRPRA